jgi:hypothetical protein
MKTCTANDYVPPVSQSLQGVRRRSPCVVTQVINAPEISEMQFCVPPVCDRGPRRSRRTDPSVGVVSARLPEAIGATATTNLLIEIDAGVRQQRIVDEAPQRDRLVVVHVLAGEMHADHLVAIEVDDAGPRVAPER